MKPVGRRSSVVLLGLALVACSSHAAEMAADLMRDAGEVLQDAGRALVDAGDSVQMDAQAQTCVSCSTSGAARGMVASEDPERLMSGYIGGAAPEKWGARPFVHQDNFEGSDIYHYKVVDGPFVLTDVVIQNFVPGEGIGEPELGQLYAVPKGRDCDYISESVLGNYGRTIIPPALGVEVPDTWGVNLREIHGLHHFVSADESLCAGSYVHEKGPFTHVLISWSGFKTYD